MCPVGRFSVVLSSTEGRAYAVFCGTDCDRRSKKKKGDQPQALAPYYPSRYTQGVSISTHSKWAFITGFDPRCAYLSIIPMETRQHTHTHTPALTKPARPPRQGHPHVRMPRTYRAPTRQFKTGHLPALACVLAAAQPAHPRPLQLTELVPIACLV